MNSSAKTVVITGVSRGLGRAMAEGFAHLGHLVIGCGRSAEAVERLAKSLGQPHDFTALDVSSDAAVKRWAEGVLGRHPAPDLLINNAAVMNRVAPLWELDAREFDQIIDINVKGVANSIRHFVPVMVRRGQGVIVNFSSGWGRSTDANVAPYCATKWAIEGLTQALAQELPSGMAAIPLNPGIINTDMLRSAFGGSASSYPSAEEWAKSAVPFLLKLGPKNNGKQMTAPG